MKILLVLIIFLQIGCAELTIYTVNVVSGITTSLIAKKLTDKKIVTEITEAKEFWKAEEYHQKYFEKHGVGH